MANNPAIFKLETPCYQELAMVRFLDLFSLSLPVWEIVVRGSVIYLSLLLLFRFVVRRDVGAVGVADLLILVLIADASQNAMAGESRTIADGLVLISTLLSWNILMDWAAFHSPKVAFLFGGEKLMLIKDGKMLRRNMRREFITPEELGAKMRGFGIDDIAEVKKAYLETDGEITVISKNGPKSSSAIPRSGRDIA